MAKAKKTENKTQASTPAAKAPAAATAKTKKAAPAKPAAAAATSAPLIDTSLAAENAAKLLAAGVNLKAGPSAGSGSNRPESSMFKQLKSGLNKPNAAAMNHLLDKTHGPAAHKSGQPFGPGSKQVGHNQTFGADVNRTGVPRRTSG